MCLVHFVDYILDIYSLWHHYYSLHFPRGFGDHFCLLCARRRVDTRSATATCYCRGTMDGMTLRHGAGVLA
jgi:hypothetical protein